MAGPWHPLKCTSHSNLHPRVVRFPWNDSLYFRINALVLTDYDFSPHFTRYYSLAEDDLLTEELFEGKQIHKGALTRCHLEE